jgi:replication factor C subunit 2/4
MSDSDNDSDTSEVSQGSFFIDDEICDVNNILDATDVIVVRNGKETVMKKKDTIQWVEKYRPNKLEEVIQQDEVIKVLQQTVKTGELPHLLFHGPSGTGKTTTILATAKQLFGPHRIEERVMELNASDDSGIKVVRNVIITFAKTAIGTADPNYPSPPFKIVILDEADAMTPEAQAALRKVMETNSEITRFCFICNYDAQIIPPIVSRCTKFRFKPISEKSIVDRLTFIASAENLTISRNGIKKIAEISGGDMRQSIMMLQNLKYISNYKTKVTPRDIIRMTGGVDEKNLPNLWEKCTTLSVAQLKGVLDSIHRKGYPVQNVLNFLKMKVLNSDISESSKSNILLEMCFADKRLSESGDEQIQLLNVLLTINKYTKIKN